MESSSNLSPLQPQAWRDILKNTNYNPREGQENAFRFACKTTANTALFVLPTGYGKTDAAFGCYAILRHRGIVNRLLYLVPTDEQRTQAVKAVNGTAIKKLKDKVGLRLGVNFSGAWRIEKEAVELRYCWDGDMEIFVATYQQVLRSDFFMELMKLPAHKWMIVYDEAHHLPQDAAWAKSSHSLPSRFTAYLSATPFRTDRKLLEGVRSVEENGEVSYVADVEVRLEDAILKEEVLKVPVAMDSQYFMDVQIPGEPAPRRMTTDSLAADGIKNIKEFSEYELRWQLRYSSKYISQIINEAVGRLNCKDSFHPGQHQMLVFCMTCKHAKAVSEQINSLSPGLADWIGVHRSDKENSDVMTRFRNNALKCLVNVDKAGEGFDNPRVSVIAFLHLVKSDLKLSQQIGRGLRRNYKIRQWKQDDLHVFCSSDTPIAEWVRNLEATLRTMAVKMGRNDVADRQMTFMEIPDTELLNTEWDKTLTVLPNAAKESKIQQLINEGGLSREQADAAFRILVTEPPLDIGTPEPADETTLRAKLKADVDKAVGTVAANVVRLRCNGSFERSVLGDMKRAIHGRWLLQGNRHGEMKSDEFKSKLEWVRGLNNAIKAKGAEGIPSWLKL